MFKIKEGYYLAYPHNQGESIKKTDVIYKVIGANSKKGIVLECIHTDDFIIVGVDEISEWLMNKELLLGKMYRGSSIFCSVGFSGLTDMAKGFGLI